MSTGRISLVSMATCFLAASTLLGAESKERLGPTCETEWFVIATGSCPAEEDRLEWCNDHLPSGCQASTAQCQDSSPEGFLMICNVAS